MGARKKLKKSWRTFRVFMKRRGNIRRTLSTMDSFRMKITWMESKRKRKNSIEKWEPSWRFKRKRRCKRIRDKCRWTWNMARRSNRSSLVIRQWLQFILQSRQSPQTKLSHWKDKSSKNTTVSLRLKSKLSKKSNYRITFCFKRNPVRTNRIIWIKFNQSLIKNKSID